MNNFPKSETQLIGESSAILELRKSISRFSRLNTPALITGEPGTGKEIVARLLHEWSPRNDKPYINVNLAAFSPELAQSELFGYKQGAFTGAIHDRKGFFEMADGGTLVLDELEYASHDIQGSLLSVLNDKEFYPIGSIERVVIDVCVIAVTRFAPEDSINNGQLRADLYHRLAITRLNVPPLRERKSDIPLLADHFLQQINKETRCNININIDAVAALMKYSFPGNVRELHDIVCIGARLCDGVSISVQDLNLPENIVVTQKPEAVAAIHQINKLQREIDYLRANTIAASPIWEGQRFPMEPDYCFVLMPFSETFDVQNVYRDHIKLVIEKRCGLRCERADDIYDISGVMQSVWEGINRACLIIADLTDRNPNVFYELGIAHTLGKPVIILTQTMDFVPFDLRHLRCIVYSYKPSEIKKLEKALERTVGTVLSSSIISGPSQRTIQQR